MPTVPKSVAWGVPAVAATAVAAGLAIVPVVAGASPALPSRSAAELLGKVSTASDVPFSGRIVQTSRLGLPEIPGMDKLTAAAGKSGSNAGSALSLLTGSHNGQIWYAGKDRVRVSATLGSTESDVIRNGRDLWVWQSSSTSVQHTLLPEDADNALAASPSTLTPQALADQALAAVTPTTDVSVDGTAKVAKRDAYELVLKPKGEGSLVRQVRLALDSETFVPLRVSVYSSKGGEPALEASFASISFDTPDAAAFTFALPSGSTLKEFGPDSRSLATALPEAREKAATATKRLQSAGSGVKVLGTGWTSIVALPKGTSSGLGLPDAATQPKTSGTGGALANLSLGTPVSGSYGKGTLIETSLVSALVLEDGRVFAGPVTPALLEKAAGA